MKRFLLIGLLLVGVGHLPADAQRKNRQIDDIYYSSKDAKEDAENSKDDDYTQETSRRRNSTAQTYNSSGDEISSDEADGTTANRSYDVDDDDYGYSARISRFSYPSYRIGYYSPWYDPFYDPWYNPWYAPYWGPSPGVTVSIGWGWGNYWGYGYPGGYYSPWAYGGYGWGYNRWGWGGGYGAGYWNGYNNGYYDGYYSGNYGGGYGGYRRNINYGPRTSMNMPRSTGMRSANGSNWNNNSNTGTGPRSGQRKGEFGRDGSRYEGRSRGAYSVPNGGFPDNGMRSGGNSGSDRAVQQERSGRFRIFGNDGGGSVQSAPDNNSRSERPSRQYDRTPNYEQRSSPSYDRSSAPSRSEPSRSSGGGGGYSPRGGGRR